MAEFFLVCQLLALFCQIFFGLRDYSGFWATFGLPINILFMTLFFLAKALE